ncbi:hypothetical protein M8756_04510 [Lutimaribacter sp. EGI FJ00015]|uniref:Uncharacterized protein n=1 Tax=Lutimaribacter degradans TaxID=2945989 RepID=A0ACC5ZTR8_9RHOB|nr:hypothetical protein [Lutimaribacter sp. EGI FJ00013]MCM2561727.1 hypothetical protein [Lutimaribacter sp. EGI FJ00013]MCO0612560.1 hypothetical protein [Lutimaribacter sp. EGI FJ00015]MCO0635219.1 hypothetical protein [Lutimaribacter sp. EGI FJ00014]
MLRLAVIFWLMMAGPLWAGAWPRGKGNVFVTALTYLTQNGTYSGIYAEWGLTDRLTLGLDVGHGVSGEEKAVAFLRLPMLERLSNHEFAWELGLGEIAGEKVIRPGLSWGKSVELAGRPGWIAVDSVAEMRTETLATDYKADLTLGLTVTDRRKIMMQFQAGVQSGDEPFLRLVPSITFGLSNRTQLEIGLTHDLLGVRDTGIKAAVWYEF